MKLPNTKPIAPAAPKVRAPAAPKSKAQVAPPKVKPIPIPPSKLPAKRVERRYAVEWGNTKSYVTAKDYRGAFLEVFAQKLIPDAVWSSRCEQGGRVFIPIHGRVASARKC